MITLKLTFIHYTVKFVMSCKLFQVMKRPLFAGRLFLEGAPLFIMQLLRFLPISYICFLTPLIRSIHHKVYPVMIYCGQSSGPSNAWLDWAKQRVGYKAKNKKCPRLYLNPIIQIESKLYCSDDMPIQSNLAICNSFLSWLLSLWRHFC